ncbi:MAG: hypothetical protein AAGG48_24675 [Planctomycetota bacterium]
MKFGFRRNKAPESLDWPGLHALLEDDDRRAAAEYFFPHQIRESFLSAVQRLNPETAGQISAAGRKLSTATRLIDWPTVAVAGMLNAGKTSLVATFLSESGRARTLRGANNDQGTHRFVLWLPDAWQKDAELWGLLMSRIGDAIGQPPEMLSEDPAAAHQQYNNVGGDDQTLTIPLVATDPRLNEVGLGLLDCPDVVSDEAFGLGSPELRRTLLGRAATLCSAFLVVTSAESSRDGTLGDLLRIASDLMPGVPRLLAVNKIRSRQTPDQVLDTFRPLAQSHGIETIYAAYDFEVPSSRPFIPGSDDSALAYESQSSETLPVFFSLSEDPDDNPPAAISDDRMLRALPQRLDRGKLFEKFRLALQSNLQNIIWDSAYPLIDRDAHQTQKSTLKAQQCLLESALDFFAHRGLGGEISELRLHQSERIIRQLSESFAATAPWYARWGVRLSSQVRRIFGGAGDLLRQLTPSAVAQKTAGEIKDKFRRGEYGGLMTPQRLASSVERHGGLSALVHLNEPDEGLDVQLWEDCAEAAISRFERDDFTSLDPKRLDAAVTKMWTEVPTHRKLAAGLTPLAAMLATFGGVLMIPIDFGATWFAAASIPELLAAAGLTTLSTLWAGNQNMRNVGRQAARQQLADFHAVLCDTFGVARPDDAQSIQVAGVKEFIGPSKIVVREPFGKTIPVYRIRDEFSHELQRIISRNGK